MTSINSELPIAISPTTKDSLTNVTALARFEFEPGRSNEGTKIMMVEWQDDDTTRHSSGQWHVSWLGKKTAFAADDNQPDSTNRLYFLLPPGESIPPSITITYQLPTSSPRSATKPQDNSLSMTVHPLPAIFTPQLGATAKAAGKKGVLHTIWAKRRLQVLAREIQQETELNLEGIALEMALAEKQWIEQNFGLVKPQPAGLKLDLGSMNPGPLSPGLQSPRSPGGRRLTEKLRGLNISTNEVNTPTHDANPLSPEVGDMAVSSFSTFKGGRPKRVVPISPPSSVTDDQAMSATKSLAEIANPEKGGREIGEGDDLFAVAMSPRSGDEPKSPFMSDDYGQPGGAFSRIKGVK